MRTVKSEFKVEGKGTCKLNGETLSGQRALNKYLDYRFEVDFADTEGDAIMRTAIWSGAAYVFRFDSSAWTPEAYLKASNAEAGDFFGNSVSISGDRIVVGASGEASNATGVNDNAADNSAGTSGAAYIH